MTKRTPGQVGYEAMLAILKRRHDSEYTPADPWEEQAPQLREDWEAVASAIIEASPEFEALRARMRGLEK